MVGVAVGVVVVDDDGVVVVVVMMDGYEDCPILL